ncbi:MupG family TIM beta-alpha barrel fold protein [Erysipelothrix rhusiopathiae]|nr:MupG family TIM beta-alpha barrel fold protein [Erysipelothrix rhusiopathiae]
MARLGISIYPENSMKEKDIAYLNKAADCGFERIFMSLLQSDFDHKDQLIQDYRLLTDAAHQRGMEVIVDVAPAVFKAFDITHTDLIFFNQIGVDGIRLDEGFNGSLESEMTFNEYGLKIELNSSQGNDYIENVMTYYPNKNALITCHNFYPQRFTGLSKNHFDYCNQKIRRLGLQSAAFVSSQNEGTFGPWPVYEGLCTLEHHRDLPIDVQIRELIATEMIDDIIIGNAYASDEELASCSNIVLGKLQFKIDLDVELSETESWIIYDHYHFVRGDMSSYMARSTMPRVTYAEASIPAKNTVDLKRGDVVVLNDEYGRYKGELHIVLESMPNDGNKNKIGRIPDAEMMLLDYIKPWRPFAFIK